MSSAPFRTAAKYAGLWGVLTFFVVLLTLVFSFLGTIICAGLAGMMMGATKASKWLSVPMSLLLPAIMIVVLRATKAEVLPRQTALVALLCFVEFWGTYLAAAGVMALERNQGKAAETAKAKAASEHSSSTQTEQSRASGTPSDTPTPRPFNLQEFEGTWLRDVSHANGQCREAVIELQNNKLVLSLLENGVRGPVIAEGELQLIAGKISASETK